MSGLSANGSGLEITGVSVLTAGDGPIEAELVGRLMFVDGAETGGFGGAVAEGAVAGGTTPVGNATVGSVLGA